jgi:quinone-modifying oxidoreductase subunit QmoC
MNFIRRMHTLGGDSLKKCYQCATCSVVCERSPDQTPFPRKEMLWAQWGLRDRLAVDPDVWLCYQCSDCSVHCPRGARPGDVLAAARLAAIERYAIPDFLPKVLSRPAALPLLILFAAAIIFLLVYLSGNDEIGWGFGVPTPPQTAEGRYPGGYFGNFLKHGPVEMIFIGGNLLVFALAGLSLMHFWKDMKKNFGTKDSPSFVQSAILAVKEILGHGAFKNCTANRARYISHLLVFYGFFAAMATAGLAVFDLKVLHHPPPLPFLHPIKILGNSSFVALVIGCLLIIIQRLTNKDAVGKGGFQDWLFLLALFTVALTGGLTQVGRNLDLDPPTLSYVFYYIHMTAVFFLLWYAPYSKFAHMFYRSLAMVFAHASGRVKGRNQAG